MIDFHDSIRTVIDEHVTLLKTMEHTMSTKIQVAVQWIVEAMNTRKKILFAGNGGSAAQAQHLAAEFIGRFQKDRPALPAIALTTDTSILTAVGNDYGFEKIFSRQIEGLINEGDLFFAISTSGNSTNLVEAAKVCKERFCKTVGLLGHDGGKLAKIVDLAIVAESSNTARIQEIHITIGHMICQIVENMLFRIKA